MDKALFKHQREEKPMVIVQDWFRDGQNKETVKTAVETVLDSTLPTSYDRMLFKETFNRVYGVIFERANQGMGWLA
jgi:hypothetical protein